MGMMRQANFPDQKALTARDETNSKPSQQSSAGSLRTVGTSVSSSSLSLKETQGRQETVPFHYHHLPAPYRPPLSLLWSACRRHLSSNSEHYLPMQSPPCDNPQWLFPDSFLPHVPMRWPRLCTSTCNNYAPVRTNTNRAHFFWAK